MTRRFRGSVVALACVSLLMVPWLSPASGRVDGGTDVSHDAGSHCQLPADQVPLPDVGVPITCEGADEPERPDEVEEASEVEATTDDAAAIDASTPSSHASPRVAGVVTTVAPPTATQGLRGEEPADPSPAARGGGQATSPPTLGAASQHLRPAATTTRRMSTGSRLLTALAIAVAAACTAYAWKRPIAARRWSESRPHRDGYGAEEAAT